MNRQLKEPGNHKEKSVFLGQKVGDSDTGQVIGIPVTIISIAPMVEKVLHLAQYALGGYVCVANVHMVTTATRNNKLLRIMEGADLVTADGMPLVWVLRQSGYKDAERVTGTDLTLQLCEAAEKAGMPTYFYGGNSKSTQGLKGFIDDKFPALQAFYEAPPVLPIQPDIDPNLLSKIRATGSRIVFVGLGCPKQEFWMAAYTPQLSAVLIGVGAAFDFLAGTVKRAPVWMQRCGLEWLHRLINDPKKTWKRYVTINPLFIWMVFKGLTKKRFRK